jgi:hypothetical protein
VQHWQAGKWQGSPGPQGKYLRQQLTGSSSAKLYQELKSALFRVADEYIFIDE